MIENDEKLRLITFIQKWVNSKIENELRSLIDLKKIKESNPELRALAYQLYENNGVVKRENIKSYINKLDQDERKKIRRIGVKFGRYHIFLFNLFKPSSVRLRIILWKSFHEKNLDFSPPTFGLNFLEKREKSQKDFMLLCGFENFQNFFVRIDILERLFMMIMNNQKEKDNHEIKLTAEMLNLLGCNKENFVKLIQQMNYKTYEKDKDIYFKYLPNRKNFKRKIVKKDLTNSPFAVLNQLNLK